jgi:hypothetical protein
VPARRNDVYAWHMTTPAPRPARVFNWVVVKRNPSDTTATRSGLAWAGPYRSTSDSETTLPRGTLYLDYTGSNDEMSQAPSTLLNLTRTVLAVRTGFGLSVLVVF